MFLFYLAEKKEIEMREETKQKTKDWIFCHLYVRQDVFCSFILFVTSEYNEAM